MLSATLNPAITITRYLCQNGFNVLNYLLPGSPTIVSHYTSLWNFAGITLTRGRQIIMYEQLNGNRVCTAGAAWRCSTSVGRQVAVRRAPVVSKPRCSSVCWGKVCILPVSMRLELVGWFCLRSNTQHIQYRYACCSGYINGLYSALLDITNFMKCINIHQNVISPPYHLFNLF